VPVDFSRKLDIALKALDLSRTRLAKLVGVDKSVASRWVSGASVPSAANLRVLTDTLKKQLPGLSLADWELGIEAFAAKLGVSAPAAAATDDAASALLLRSIATFRRDIDREAPVYEGFYLTYNRSSANNGDVTRRAVKIWRDGERLRFLSSGVSSLYDVEGETFVWRGKLFFFGEMRRYDGVSLTILNGTAQPTPTYLTGVAAGLGADTLLSPNATAMVMEFHSRFCGDANRDEHTWRGLVGTARELAQSGTGANALPPAIAQFLDIKVGLPGPGGEIDWLLRVPVTRAPA
jgi:transcriptional regulator with XRE-family HTH domain